MNPIKYEINTFHSHFQPSLTSRKKCLKNLYYNFICSIMIHDFYVITLWMHFKSLGETKLIAIVNWIFHVSDFSRFFISFKYGLILLRYSSINRLFIFITITFIFNIILAPKITYSYWFVIVFPLLKKAANISNYVAFDFLYF